MLTIVPANAKGLSNFPPLKRQKIRCTLCGYVKVLVGTAAHPVEETLVFYRWDGTPGKEACPMCLDGIERSFVKARGW